MENETKQQGMLKPALQYGLVMAIAIIMLSLVFYIAGAATSKWAGWLSYPVIIGLLVFSIMKFRDEHNGGFITYGRALGFGTLVGVFAGLIYAVYVFVFYKFIGPEVLDEIHLKIEEEILTKSPNLSAAEFEMALKMAKSFSSPIVMTIGSIFSYALMGFIFSLIISIFLKKAPKEELV